MSEREEVLRRYIFSLPPYYQNDQKNKEFEQRAQNFEPSIHYVIEQNITTQGIKMSKGVEPVLVPKQETIILPIAKSIVAECVPMAIKVRYSEPRFNQHNGSIV
jgi:hypothetical protein